ncbi:cation efflux family-domain-containing protein [Syncephalis fuscata]|nr:cation efflux family-domain-containing protein [Syncephalis fuscata]
MAHPSKRSAKATCIRAPSKLEFMQLAYKEHQVLFLWTTLQLFTTIGVWFHGHHAESLALTAYAYFLFFDLFGLFNLLVSRTIRSSSYYTTPTLEHPFGLRRIEILFSFTNVIYMLFMSIYVTKEGMEHVILTHHSEHNHADFFMSFLVLICAVLVTAVSSLVFRHHAQLDRLNGRPQGPGSRFGGEDTLLGGLLKSSFTKANLFCCAIVLFSRFMVAISAYPALLDQLACMSVAIVMVYSVQSIFFAISKLLMQSATHVEGVDSALNELTSQPGVLGYLEEHFWTDAYGRVVGTLMVIADTNANPQGILASAHRSLGGCVHHLTVQVVRQAFA